MTWEPLIALAQAVVLTGLGYFNGRLTRIEERQGSLREQIAKLTALVEGKA